MINFNRIESDIFIGSAPQSRVDVARLLEMKISAVISLQSDEEFSSHGIDWKKIQSAYKFNNIMVHRFQIIDFDETDMSNRLVPPVRNLHDLLTLGHRIYVHCNAGVCRAPGTVLAYLCHYRGMTVDEGLSYIRRERPQVNPYVNAVKKTLDQLAFQDKS